MSPNYCINAIKQTTSSNVSNKEIETIKTSIKELQTKLDDVPSDTKLSEIEETISGFDKTLQENLQKIEETLGKFPTNPSEDFNSYLAEYCIELKSQVDELVKRVTEMEQV